MDAALPSLNRITSAGRIGQGFPAGTVLVTLAIRPYSFPLSGATCARRADRALVRSHDISTSACPSPRSACRSSGAGSSRRTPSSVLPPCWHVSSRATGEKFSACSRAGRSGTAERMTFSCPYPCGRPACCCTKGQRRACCCRRMSRRFLTHVSMVSLTRRQV